MERDIQKILKNKMNSAASKEKNSHEELAEDAGDLFQYNCPDCGAVIVADEQTTATFCVYCGNTAILKNKLAGKFHPSSIIPFKKTKEDATEAFKSLSKGRLFVPKDFTDEKNIEKIMNRYGRTVCAVDGNGKKFAEKRCFIQPLRYKNKMYLYGVNTEIGYNSQGHYLYIGPPDPDLSSLENGEYVKCGDEKYRIDRAERVYKGNEVFYIWAIIRVIVEN